ncbi:PHP domain-containing protein, partial [Kineococcus glutinatus]|uniref:PHP domain-containing protein n=1 Tax=Kineococcus glutinatus TaxID=1070872 RepID=UPI0031F10AFC
MGFVHLHVASTFSYHHGVTPPSDLVAAAAAAGADAAALTDRDRMSGLVRHVAACRAAGIDAVAGIDLTLLDGAGAPAGRC